MDTPIKNANKATIQKLIIIRKYIINKPPPSAIFPPAKREGGKTSWPERSEARANERAMRDKRRDRWPLRGQRRCLRWSRELERSLAVAFMGRGAAPRATCPFTGIQSFRKSMNGSMPKAWSHASGKHEWKGGRDMPGQAWEALA